MKVKITQPGVHFASSKGKPAEEIEVGETIDVVGVGENKDELPNFLVGKGEILGKKPKKAEAVTNEENAKAEAKAKAAAAAAGK